MLTHCRKAATLFGAFALLWFSWDSYSRGIFNGLASPLFFALSAYLVFLAMRYEIAVSRRSLVFFACFAIFAVIADARSGEFLPALAVDTHWFVLPIAVLLLSRVFAEFPAAFLGLRIGAALCIVNLLLTMYFNAEWYDNWRLPPIFGHFRHMGLSIGFMVVLLCSDEPASRLLNFVFRLSRILGMALVIWTSSRAALLAWCLALPFFVLANRRFAMTLIIDVGVAALLAQIPAPPSANLAGVSLVKRTFSSAATGQPWSVRFLSGRLLIWESTLSELSRLHGLWFGIGGNGFARLQTLYGALVKPPGHVHAHNFIVQGLCDWGIVGLSCLMGFFFRSTVKPLVAAWRAAKAGLGRRADPTALAGILYIALTGQFDATLYHLEHLNYLAFALALQFARMPRPANAARLPAFGVIAVLLGCALIHAASLDYRIGLGWYFPTG